VQLYIAAEDLKSAIPVAEKLAAMKTHADNAAAISALSALDKRLIAAGKIDELVGIWDRVPNDADLQPSAARHAAEMAMWWTGDFAKAVKLLKPISNRNDPGLHRQYGQALVLAGQVDEGRKILENEPTQVPANRKAALSGAAARTVEFFITNNDPESGEEAWDKWQARFPADFLEGYSVMLRTKLMELRKRPDAAAKLAEAFAAAEPLSPYAPQLLDRASKLLASADPTKSQALHQLLKQKYPEDPLSQD
jgi:thioredoxin-like negative regulator of GroEL